MSSLLHRPMYNIYILWEFLPKTPESVLHCFLDKLKSLSCATVGIYSSTYKSFNIWIFKRSHYWRHTQCRKHIYKLNMGLSFLSAWKSKQTEMSYCSNHSNYLVFIMKFSMKCGGQHWHFTILCDLDLTFLIFKYMNQWNLKVRQWSLWRKHLKKNPNIGCTFIQLA